MQGLPRERRDPLLMSGNRLPLLLTLGRVPQPNFSLPVGGRETFACSQKRAKTGTGDVSRFEILSAESGKACCNRHP